jgi:multidrug resistance efflux pump
VEPQDELARLDNIALDLAVADARAAVASSRLAITRLETSESVEMARLEVERAKNSLWAQQSFRDAICGAYERKMAQETDCHQAQANVQAGEQGVQIAEARYRAAMAVVSDEMASAKANLDRARLGLTQAEENRARALLTSPITGTVTRVHLLEGMEVSPGAPVVTLAPAGAYLFVTTNLDERNVPDVRIGADATISLTAFPDETLAGTVERVALQGVEDPGGAVVFTVYIGLDDDHDLPVMAGMTGRAEIAVPVEQE